jgi:hypothetical protein
VPPPPHLPRKRRSLPHARQSRLFPALNFQLDCESNHSQKSIKRRAEYEWRMQTPARLRPGASP